MSFVLHALGKYREMQIKIRKEIEETIGIRAKNFSYEELNQLEYLDMFIQECLRVYTIVPLTGRQTTADTKIGNITYCKGVTLWVNMYGLAHDEKFFPEPEKFMPERFTKDRQKDLPPYSFIPFSGGPHICIGRKFSLLLMKVLIIVILQKFNVRLRDPNEELEVMSQMVLKATHGIHLIFDQSLTYCK